MTSATSSRPTPALVYATLRELIDPEVGLNVIDLGMVGNVEIASDGAVIIEIIPTSPGCPMHDALSRGAQHLVGDLAGVTAVQIRFVHDPPWTPDRISPEARALLGLLG